MEDGLHKKYIQKSRQRWFGNVIQMRQERILKKMLKTNKLWENDQVEDPEPYGSTQLERI